MVHYLRKIFTLFIFCIILIESFCIFSSAKSADETVISFKSPGNDIISISHLGDWHSFPENTIESINAASCCDIVSVNVKITQDSRVILFSDDTVDRMCVDSNGEAASGCVSTMTLEQLQALYLRSGKGGAINDKTKCRIPTLEEALDASDKTVLMLNVAPENLEITLDCIKKANAVSRIILRINSNNSKIIDAVKNDSSMPTVVGNYQGNIIFLATKVVNDCFDNSINTVELGSKNGHGVLYDNFLMKRFANNGRAFVSMVNGRCGKRTDNERGWDDLISRGYSVIETDYPEELSQYIAKISESKQKLQKYIDLYSGIDLDPYTTDSEKAFNTAFSSAESIVGNSSSLSQTDDARYNLQSTHDNLTLGAKKAVTLAFEFTAGRIIAVILCAAALIISQILLFKKSSKNK